MLQLIKKTIYLALCLLLVSCNTSERKKTNAIDNIPVVQLYSYAIDTAGISILWTAYKFTNKVGVSGTFDDFTFNNKNEFGSVEKILNKSKLSIPTASINSGNAIRDFKLKTYFFDAFNTSLITGIILNANKGEGLIKLRMNRKSQKTPYTYSFQNDTIILFTNLDLNSWKAEEALTTLNKECYELHKGDDGISKLWPELDVQIKLPVTKTLITDWIEDDEL